MDEPKIGGPDDSPYGVARRIAEAATRGAVRSSATGERPREAYIDGTDFAHHLEMDAYPVKVYRSAAECQAANPGHKECGVLRVLIVPWEWTVEPTPEFE